MRRYETIFIVRPNAGESETTEVIDKATAIVDNTGGTVIKVDKWGLKKLAYLIKKETQGYYVYIDYAGQPASVAEMERIFRIDDRVLKYMTVKLSDSCDSEELSAALAAAATTAMPADLKEATTETEEIMAAVAE